MDKINNFNNYKKFVNKLDDNIKDIHGDEYDSGSLYSYYVHNKLGLNIINYEPEYKYKIINIYDLKNFNFDSNGIYSFLSENLTELNYFIIVIKDDNLTLLSMYSGQKEFIQITFNKNEWLNMLKDLYLLNNIIENKIEIYKKIFGIKKVYFDELKLDIFSFHYTKINLI